MLELGLAADVGQVDVVVAQEVLLRAQNVDHHEIVDFGLEGVHVEPDVVIPEPLAVFDEPRLEVGQRHQDFEQVLADVLEHDRLLELGHVAETGSAVQRGQLDDHAAVEPDDSVVEVGLHEGAAVGSGELVQHGLDAE